MNNGPAASTASSASSASTLNCAGSTRDDSSSNTLCAWSTTCFARESECTTDISDVTDGAALPCAPSPALSFSIRMTSWRWFSLRSATATRSAAFSRAASLSFFASTRSSILCFASRDAASASLAAVPHCEARSDTSSLSSTCASSSASACSTTSRAPEVMRDATGSACRKYVRGSESNCEQDSREM